MTYTAWEILIFLILAFILGFLLAMIWFRSRKSPDQSQTIESLRTDLAACKQARADLEAQVASKGTPDSAPKKEAPAAAKPAKTKEVFETDAPKPEAFGGANLESAKANPDDLKKIKGVGPVMEGILNGHGCYTFEQVAGLSDKDVEWVAANINTFPDRIVRDDWVGQAKKLAKAKS